MYQQFLNFLLVTQNNELGDILGKILPPEDCQYRLLQTDVCQPDLSPALDRAVIVDYSQGAPETADLPADHSCIVILQAGEVKRHAAAMARRSAELWVIAGTLSENAQLLQSYFLNTIRRMKEQADYRKEKICMETALDSIPDLAWFKALSGAHLMVNQGFCEAVQKTKEQIYKKGHYYVWDIPKEEYETGDYVCLESEQVVIDAGETCLFDEKVKTKSGMRKFKTYKSPLYDKDGTLFGTCGIAHDVTELSNLTTELMMVLESMPFAVIVEDDAGMIISINTRFCEFFPQYKDIEGHSFDEWRRDAAAAGVIKSYDSELHVMTGDEEKILLMEEEPIYDVFDQQIGRIRIFRNVTMERKYEKRMRDYANTDFMTGLNNRRSLFDYLAEKNNVEQLTFLTIDLDNFKQVNDRHGHHMGDLAILIAVNAINNYFTKEFKARLGGDEFLVVADYVIGEEDMISRAEKFLQFLIESFQEKEELREMTASIGIACSCHTKRGPHDIEQLMKNSDHALYDAKYSGKSRVCFYRE